MAAPGTPSTASKPSQEAVWDTIIAGDSAALRQQLEAHGPAIVGIVGAEGQTALHLACDVADGVLRVRYKRDEDELEVVEWGDDDANDYDDKYDDYDGGSDDHCRG